ncbi:MAG: AraC family transcriptional regulator [Bacillota bacterium]
MHWVAKVQEAIDYIEENLLEDISLESVGKAIHYAPSSFQNLFSALTGYSIGEYIRFRRLSLAAEELTDSLASVTEVSMKYGYETAEAFAKAFKRLFNCAPSKYGAAPQRQKFHPIKIEYRLHGGYGMARNWIPGLMKVDWADPHRQNEYVNSVVSALNALGERLNYDMVCALSGSAFRTSFSMPSAEQWNHGNYHVIHTPILIEHTFRMLGYQVAHHIRGDYRFDRQLIIDSIDQGVPVITLEGVINCSDACVISGYDNDGDVLLGYNPFMDVNEDHKEAPDDTGYFRKSNWHNGFFEKGSIGRILIIGEKAEKLPKKTILQETLCVMRRLIADESIVPGQYNGLAAHRAFANALQHYEWDDPFEPYLNVMCNEKQYIDRQYAVPFFRENSREDLARQYEKIAEQSRLLIELIPQDFSASGLFNDKRKLLPFCDALMRICDLEEKVLAMIG